MKNVRKRAILFLIGGGSFLFFYFSLPLCFQSKFLETLRKAVLSLSIICFTLFHADFLTNLFRKKVSSLKEVLPPTSLLEHLIKVLVFIIGGLVLLRSLGISITPALAGLGIGGLAVALALQGPLANFFSGIHLLLSKQIRIGDYIKLETGEEGYIVDITWRNTTIKQLSNNIVIIPNSKLASLIIVNYDQPEKELSIPINIGISYSSDLEKVERVTLEVAKEVMREVPGGVPEFEPVVRYHSFGEYSINFTVILRAKGYTDQFLIKHEFIKRLYLRYKKEGIEIPFPIRVIYLKEK
jgi:small-conductance mechanosensitive channel